MTKLSLTLSHEWGTNRALTADVSEEEIEVTIFSLGENKAPGEDGFNGRFFRRYWEIIKVNVI